MRTWPTEDIGAVETFDIRLVVVVRVKRVHQLADIVRLVAGLLHPDGEPVVVEAALDELGVAACQ